MADDFYATLGVPRSASQADIDKAYRKLARKYHPDANPDDPSATKRFQELQKAYDILKDPEKREMYDRYGSSFEGMGAGGPRGSWAGGAAGGSSGPWAGNAEDIDFSRFFGERFGGDPGMGGFTDLFSQFTRAQGTSRGGRTSRRRGADVVSEARIPFATAVLGGEVRLTITRAGGKTETLSVKIPPGIEDGKKIRLRGQGESGAGGAAGDLLVTVRVAPHPHFHRQGQQLYIKVPVTLGEAVLGGKVDVPTPRGTVSLRVPPGTSSGAKLRIKGHGVPAKDGSTGDLLAEIQIVVPKQLDAESERLAREFDARNPQNPRDGLAW